MKNSRDFERNMHSVVLVDDDREDQAQFAEAISRLSKPVDLRIFDNGIDLMQFLFSGGSLPDMVFLDLHMPMMNGEECLADIRQESEFDKIPVLIYSSVYDWSRIERLFNMGANLFLQKPVSLNELVQSLESCISAVLRNGHRGKTVYRVFS